MRDTIFLRLQVSEDVRGAAELVGAHLFLLEGEWEGVAWRARGWSYRYQRGFGRRTRAVSLRVYCSLPSCVGGVAPPCVRLRICFAPPSRRAHHVCRTGRRKLQMFLLSQVVCTVRQLSNPSCIKSTTGKKTGALLYGSIDSSSGKILV